MFLTTIKLLRKKYKTSKSNFGIENLNKDIEVGLVVQ